MMGVNRKFLYWGAFFVATGAVMLAADLYGIDDAVVADVLRLWPLAIVAVGAALVLRRTRFSLAGGMVAAAMPGLVLGGLIAVGPRLATTCGVGQPASTSEQQGAFNGPAAVDIQLGCGELAITTTSGSAWQLQTGNTEDTAAIVDATASRLSVATGRRDGWFGAHGRDVWRLAVPTASRLDVSLEIDAGTGRVNLAGAQLGAVDLAINAADAHVDLGDAASLDHLSAKLNAGATSLRLPAQDFDGNLTVNAGSLRICAPPGLGLRISATTSLGSARFPGLLQSGGTWESPDYATASHRADLTVAVNVGSVDLNPIGGCQ